MASTLCRFALLLLIIIAPAAPAHAADVQIGDHVKLRATNPLGVPLHAAPRPSLSGRAADGTVAAVLELANEGRWLKLGQRVDHLIGKGHKVKATWPRVSAAVIEPLSTGPSSTRQ